jgi:TolB-like protein
MESMATTRSVTAAPAAQKRKMRRWTVIGAVCVIAIASLATGAFFELRSAPRLTAKDTIVLADFTNATGDSVFDDTLRRGLSVQLEQSPFLSVISDDQVQQTLQMMDQKPDARLTPEIARQVCRRAGSAAVLDGSIAQIGAQYLLTLKAVNCESGNSLASTEARADDKNHVLDALGQIASDMRGKLGESLATVQQFDTPLEQATTPSLEALQSFSEGFKTLYGPQGSGAAIPLFRRATEEDPNFAAAYAMLGRMEGDISEYGSAVKDATKAYELRDRASEAEKYFISANYHSLVTGDLKKTEQDCLLWLQDYPRAAQPRNLLGGPVYLQLGAYQKAVEQGEEAVRGHPDLPIGYAQIIWGYTAQGHLDDAKDAYQRGVAQKIDSVFLSLPLYPLDFLAGDSAGMEKLVAESAGKPGVEDAFLANDALTAAYSGHLGKARDLAKQSEASVQSPDEKEAAASYAASAALIEALFGNAAEARQQAAKTLRLSTARDNEYAAALALGFAGDTAQTESLAKDLAKRLPDDTVAQFNYLPTLAAQIAINRNEPAKAVDDLQPAAAYELGGPGSGFFAFLAGYPVYVRGEAFLAARKGSAAAAEFQKIIDHAGVVLNEPIGALAHLQLARAYALEGDAAKSRAAYQQFLALWKDSDPDIPAMTQAQSEYARLGH